ncbi:MAG: PspA/IM30 family protein [Pseudomonadota bacterium]
MNVWAKMITALRGGVNEAGEAVVDSQALRILDQEIRDAAEELRTSKESLAAIIARQKLAEEKAKATADKIAEHESYATQAIDKGDEALALEIAGKIADLEAQHETEKKAGEGFADSAEQLRNAIQGAERDLQMMRQQIDTVKAAENVQKAQAAVSARHSGSNSKLRTAKESLERIKERQDLRAAQMRAANDLESEMGDSSLEERLLDAGIKPGRKSADEILSRIKAKSKDD